MITQERLKIEYAAMAAIFPTKQFHFFSDKLIFAVQTNSRKVYTVKVDLSGNYPYEVPKVFITNPHPLYTKNGQSMLEPSHQMHALRGENGCVRVCHYGQIDWHPGVTCYQVIVKVRVWLEMYEAHLKTGRPLDYYLTSAAY